MAVDPLLGLSIGELCVKLRSGETSPTALARAAIEALDSRGRELNAVATIMAERAMRSAEKAEAELASGHDRGPLHGIPWGAKDLLAAVGAPTTWGAAPFRDQVFDFDATVVRRLEAAGAVLVAKLAMVELAGGMGYEELDAAWTGPGRNPWDLDSWAGGSSSGSGAAVAARLLPFAIGSETFGSIVTPASYCGISGLRPTYGRVSRYGAMALSWTLDKLGPLARSADDCGLVLDAIAGPDENDPTSVQRTFHHPAPKGSGQRRHGFRFAVPAGWRDGTEPQIVDNIEESLDTLRGIGTIEEVALPDMPSSQAARIIIAAEGASAFENIIEDGRVLQLRAPSCRVKPHVYAALPARDYLRAMRVRRQVSVEYDRIMAEYDAIVGPTTGDVSPLLTKGLDRSTRSTTSAPIGAPGNLAGLPAIAVPNGLGDRGMPTSLQFTGRAWTESRLLAIAMEYQATTEHHRAVPAG
ncbi:MAG TPA: amidase [Dehalococcoidia bacterium]|jgi:aspartyl-tRNA(Asn)/glutamyl-tRNA(Gln) amidotransferase subunit A|nr:amidase [Chloroflexota bacterium]MDP5876184.1 amidase [Dehalococcoidia bacterium]MDP6273028.1 amidase [Dehalococcoidia bacterium]MDP7160858.1 amidase [Dehalococcoidia bacterium]MDP7212715.1 amidase [Dehalococcoidia bacterium]|tara:strand:- start:140 stop:1546 length:1407 start_codon:yes stop_codon:yes gene_type:complete